jgi:general secretion pathway protein A
MYKSFYKLKRNPFEITPDPSFLFPTRRHNEALAALYYGVRRHKGFVVMTGEVGTGKTLLVRCLLELLNRKNVAYAYVFNSILSPMEFLQYIAGDLGLPTSGKNKSELLLDLSSFLIARHQQKLTTVLVVDEAITFRWKFWKKFVCLPTWKLQKKNCCKSFLLASLNSI